MTTIEEMRKYIRHPTDIPIECSVPNVPIEDRPRMRNVSRSGLSFSTHIAIAPGSNVHLAIPINGANFEVDGIVMWRQDMDNRYEMGVKFSDDKTEFTVRMIEQLCHIEQYRQQVNELEGREIDSEQAGKEWVKKFANTFPE